MLGVEHLEMTPDKVVVRFTITTNHLQPFGIPHGGIYCAVHESTASYAGFLWFGGKGVVVGTNNSTDFLRQAKVGDTITTTATPIHRGRTQQLWHLDSVDQDDRLIAQGQVRLANIEQELPDEIKARFGVV
ncbi:PaaI family thioesterase [Aeromicrobium sp. UC242_57]|uniref:PaaI family thioesterase n=1 Tax=Aeromicrobium sp. UC242_57 TaxID=3374624 RepID=UPI0037978D1D